MKKICMSIAICGLVGSQVFVIANYLYFAACSQVFVIANFYFASFLITRLFWLQAAEQPHEAEIRDVLFV